MTIILENKWKNKIKNKKINEIKLSLLFVILTISGSNYHYLSLWILTTGKSQYSSRYLDSSLISLIIQ